MQRHADWTAWTFRLTFGMAAGFLLGVMVGVAGASRRGHSLLADGCVLPFFLGCALVGGSLATHYGDRMWPESAGGMPQPTEQGRSVASVICFAVIGVAGLLLVGYALLRTLRVM